MSELNRLNALDRAHLIHPHRTYGEQVSDDPRIVRGGEGIRLEMSDGRRVIDAFSGLWNVNVGHGRPEIGEAVKAQLDKLAYYPSFYDYSNEPAIELGAKLASLIPAGRSIDRFLFTSGGSEANETAFHFARQYHSVRGNRDKVKVVSRNAAYHGVTRAAVSATRLKPFHFLEAPDPLHVQIASPNCFRCDLEKTYPSCNVACADDLLTLLEREDPATVAAVIAEPVMGTGGVIIPKPEYFDRLQAICKDHDILLILDEVITGFGRTGTWFGMEHWDAKPDILTFAKGITSGYVPLGGVGLAAHVFDALRSLSPKGLPFMNGLTYNNHPTACAAALANIAIIESEGLVEHVAEASIYLKDSLQREFGGRQEVGDIRVCGFMAAIEWVSPRTKEPLGAKRGEFPRLVREMAWEEGLIVRPLWENTAMAPPLCTSRDDIDEIVEKLSRAVEKALATLE